MEFSMARETKAFGKPEIREGFTAQKNTSLREGQRENPDCDDAIPVNFSVNPTS
jgi:hypothetical protein